MKVSWTLTRTGRTVFGVVVVIAIALQAGCATQPETIEVPAAVPTAQTEYRIGPGDMLQVFVWNQPELTVTVPVRPDGMISTPLISGVPAAGKTAPELSKDLEAALSEYVRNPTVSVMVTSFVGDVCRPDPRRRPGRQAAGAVVSCQHDAARRDDRRRRPGGVRRRQSRRARPAGRRQADAHPGPPPGPDRRR